MVNERRDETPAQGEETGGAAPPWYTRMAVSAAWAVGVLVVGAGLLVVLSWLD